ncbi:MAG: thioredoxin [Candidatus Magasanikbacteria bacterium]|nr:thioredoxin [Candidatus Magasanikbacteria bacterium]
MSEQIFTDANFEEEVVNSEVPVLVDFFAPWCGPCKMMGPIVEEVANENVDKAVKIGKLNVDENNISAGKYGVMSIPTFLVFKNGEVVDQAMGGIGKEKLQELIDKNI